MSARGPRLPLLMALATLIGWLVLAAPEAQAQVFKPRGKMAAGKTATATAAAARKAAPAATPAKKPARTAGANPRRAANATPVKKAKSAGKARDEDDVKIEDDEDDVKIIDD